MIRFTLLLVLFLLGVIIVGADECPPEREQTPHDEARLHKDLFCAYHTEIRPVQDPKTPVTIKVRFAIKYISFDALEESFTVHSWVALAWRDAFLSWTPSDYGNILETQVESHEIWSPRMALFNADASLYQSDQIYTTCLLSKDGNVTCVPHVAHTGMCRTSLKRWPYDVQNCTLFFGSWMHSGEQVNFTLFEKNPIIVDDFQDGPGWKLLKVIPERMPGIYKCCPNTTYPMLKYTFVMKREAAGLAAIIVVPSVVIVLLTLSSMLMDIKDMTRLLLICFSLYGHFMFLTEIGYSLPKQSSDTPIILLFLRDSMIVTLTGILETLLLMYLRRRVLPPPTWIVSFNRIISGGPGKYVIFTEFDPSNDADIKVLAEEGTSNIEEKESRVSNDWIQFASFLNSALFIVMALVYLILVSTYIPYDD